jgi:hypothetical protein
MVFMTTFRMRPSATVRPSTRGAGFSFTIFHHIPMRFMGMEPDGLEPYNPCIGMERLPGDASEDVLFRFQDR